MLAVARAHGHRCALGSVTLLRDPIVHLPLAVRLLRLRIRPGAIVVLHEGLTARANIAVCVDRLLTQLARSGYTARSLSTLVAMTDDVARSSRLRQVAPREAAPHRQTDALEVSALTLVRGRATRARLTAELSTGGRMEHRIEDLSATRCMELLAGGSIGRVAVNDDEGPVVLPVNYVVDRDSIVFRSAEGTKLSAALHATAAAFEIDKIDVRACTGWSVVVRGTLSQVTAPSERAHLRQLPLHPFAGGDKEHFVRLQMRDIAGRRIEFADSVTGISSHLTGLGNVWLDQDASDLGV